MHLYAEEKLTERKVQQYTVEYFKKTHYLSALLLLYISLIPLTELLIRLNTGYEGDTVSHWLYKDSLKLIGVMGRK
jgi:hypothetical protein